MAEFDVLRSNDQAVQDRSIEVGEILTRIFPPGIGFLLLTFALAENERQHETPWNYVSNADRNDVLENLKLLISLMEEDKAKEAQIN